MDPGGYFIVRGSEKVIIMQEQMSKNRIIVEEDSKRSLLCSVTSSTHLRKSKTNVITKRGRYFVEHNSFGEPVPILIMLKAMGCVSDQFIFDLVGGDALVTEALEPCAEDCQRMNVSSHFDFRKPFSVCSCLGRVIFES